ncbi:sensor domain-containing diguanylate cyclase [Shewanella marinintestina]|uniref:sensor domain-containing protein n=1 Tax=Shewanella marinintestina TaxID=190305 RepID=UPI00200FE529|nr:sensor domain-containing diguanylate cyclase [Shewanella marinintestina]MCL1147425.1 sensor domain-containing diguanylate cyclase [Shewanella marinintestina]
MLDTLVKHSNDAIYIIEPDSGTILSCNYSAYRRLQYSSGDFNGIKIFDIDINIHDLNEWKDVALRIKNEHNSVYETYHKKLDGSIFPVENSVSISTYQGVEYFIAIARDITARKEYEKSAWRRANLDPLTGLPNRRIFYSDLKNAAKKTKEKDEHLAMLYIDLDWFKRINDKYGHAVGDEVLYIVGKRLQGCCRNQDCLSRLGGDEFSIVFSNIATEELGRKMVHKVEQVLRQPFCVGDLLLEVGASIGAIIFRVKQFDCTQELSLADKAMYRAKEHFGVSASYHFSSYATEP